MVVLTVLLRVILTVEVVVRVLVFAFDVAVWSCCDSVGCCC